MSNDGRLLGRVGRIGAGRRIAPGGRLIIAALGWIAGLRDPSPLGLGRVVQLRERASAMRAVNASVSDRAPAVLAF